MSSSIRTLLLRHRLPSLLGASSLPLRSQHPTTPFGSIPLLSARLLSSSGGTGGDGGGEKNDSWDKNWESSDQPPSSTSDGLDWGEASSWSTGLTKEHFDGQAVGRQVAPTSTSELLAQAREMDEEEEMQRLLQEDVKKHRAFVDGWGERMVETCNLLAQVREPGLRGGYLRDSEKAEMYRLHKENPEVYTVEKLAKNYKIMRQRVHAILWLKEMEEEEERKRGKPLDDSVEILLDSFPE